MAKVNLDVLIPREDFEIAEKTNIATSLFKEALISQTKSKTYRGLIHRNSIAVDYIK